MPNVNVVYSFLKVNVKSAESKRTVRGSWPDNLQTYYLFYSLITGFGRPSYGSQGWGGEKGGGGGGGCCEPFTRAGSERYHNNGDSIPTLKSVRKGAAPPAPPGPPTAGPTDPQGSQDWLVLSEYSTELPT